MRQIRVKKVYLFIKRKVKNFSYRKAIVFLVCLALSSFLWLLNSLEKRYTGRISVPITYVEFPKDRQLSNVLPQKFDLMVDAYGYTLLVYKLRLALSPVLLNVTELVDNAIEKGYRNKFTVSTVNHKEEIEKQISSEIRILSIKPDSLIFNFSKIISKRIKVRPNVKIGFESQYSLMEEPFTTPDSVLVSGPKNVLDTMKFVYTNFHFYSRLSHSVEEKATIQSIRGLTIPVTEVKLSVPVEQNTEVSFEVPIVIINKPDNIVLKTFPGKVKVSCRIGLSKYKDLDYNAFHAFINYEKISLSDTKLPVLFESSSKAVLSVSFAPKDVEYILEHEK